MIDSTESIDPNDLNNDFIDLNDPNNDPNYPKNDSTDQIDLNGDRSNRFDRIIRIQQSSPLDYRFHRLNNETSRSPRSIKGNQRPHLPNEQSSPLDYRLYRPNGENPTFPSNDQQKPTSTSIERTSTSIERTFSSTNCNLHGEPTTQRRRFAPSESSSSAERQSWTTRQT